MSNKLNEKIYRELINEDIAVLNKHLPDCVERDHIESVLKNSIGYYYPNSKIQHMSCDKPLSSQTSDLIGKIVDEAYETK